jgi:hypothetical protein
VSGLDYELEIAQFPYLDSERELILRALLGTETDTEQSASSGKGGRGALSSTPIRTGRGVPPTGSGRMHRVDSNLSGMSDGTNTGTNASSVDDCNHNPSHQSKKRGGSGSVGGSSRHSQEEGGGEEVRSKRKRREEVRQNELALICFILCLCFIILSKSLTYLLFHAT